MWKLFSHDVTTVGRLASYTVAHAPSWQTKTISSNSKIVLGIEYSWCIQLIIHCSAVLQAGLTQFLVWKSKIISQCNLLLCSNKVIDVFFFFFFEIYSMFSASVLSSSFLCFHFHSCISECVPDRWHHIFTSLNDWWVCFCFVFLNLSTYFTLIFSCHDKNQGCDWKTELLKINQFTLRCLGKSSKLCFTETGTENS